MDGFTEFIVDEMSRPDIEENEKRDFPILVELIERCWHNDPDSRPNFEEICALLTDAMVEIAIAHDRDAQNFWLKFFSKYGSQGVKIDRCVKALLKWFRLPSNPEMRSKALETQIKYLKMVMHEKDDLTDDEEENSKARITVEWFGSLINWFGPLDKDFLKRVGSMCSKVWFHGRLSGSHASRLLNGRADGFYLVRFSATEPGYYTISCIRGGKVTHIRIIHPPCSQEYSVGVENRQTFKSISELLEKEKNFLELSVACPGSRFNPIEEVSGYMPSNVVFDKKK